MGGVIEAARSLPCLSRCHKCDYSVVSLTDSDTRAFLLAFRYDGRIHGGWGGTPVAECRELSARDGANDRAPRTSGRLHLVFGRQPPRQPPPVSRPASAGDLRAIARERTRSTM